jgi:hypothetical protein
MVTSQPQFEIEFRWREHVIYWEGARGCVFQGAWGVDPPITIVPDAKAWDRVVPPFLLGGHDEVLANSVPIPATKFTRNVMTQRWRRALPK